MHSTALSDLVLALATVIFIPGLLIKKTVYSWFAGLALILVAMAAVMGVAYWQFWPGIKPYYHLCSAMAGQVAIPVLALSAWGLARGNVESFFLICLSLLVFFFVFEFMVDISLYRLIIGGLAMLLIATAGYFSFHRNTLAGVALIAGSLLTILAGLVIGTRGQLWGYLRVDLFHYLLALANLGLGYGLFVLARLNGSGKP